MLRDFRGRRRGAEDNPGEEELRRRKEDNVSDDYEMVDEDVSQIPQQTYIKPLPKEPPSKNISSKSYKCYY